MDRDERQAARSFDDRVYSGPQRLIEIEPGRRLNVHVVGEGRPAVILAAGAGGSTIQWCLVQPTLALRTKVVSYDRAGLGFSDAGPLPAAPSRAVADMRLALRGLEIEPPYVLVGASRGALEARLFAFRRPEEVAGLVLVDPAKEDQGARFRAVAPAMSAGMTAHLGHLRDCADCAASGRLVEGSDACARCLPPPNPRLSPEVNAALADIARKPAYWRTMLSEYEEGWTAADAELREARGSLGDLPLIVLTRGLADTNPLPPAEAEAFERVSKEMHAELAAESSRGVLRVVAGASHAIFLERPAAVIEAVGEVLDQVAGR